MRTRRPAAFAAALCLLMTGAALAPAQAATTLTKPFEDGITRLSGNSRYGTSLGISELYSPGVPTVFVSTGENFPDALSAASAAATLGGPLLLHPNSSAAHPQLVGELKRLKPGRIAIVGGTGAVSAGVEAALKEIAPVIRVGGTDRYDTGRKIVKTFFTTSNEAFVATGTTFPDALAASGAAGTKKAPVVLVDGALGSVPAATIDVLRSLGTKTISIAGGTGAVSPAIESQLKSLGYTVNRFGGASRYETATLINENYFKAGSTPYTFMATGENFPDALSGAALAGFLGAPMFVTTKTCVPAMAHNAINTLDSSKRVVLGGEGVLTLAAAQNTSCAPATTPSATASSGWTPAPTASPTSTFPKASTEIATMECGDFKTQARAQRWYDDNVTVYGAAQLAIKANENGKVCKGVDFPVITVANAKCADFKNRNAAQTYYDNQTAADKPGLFTRLNGVTVNGAQKVCTGFTY